MKRFALGLGVALLALLAVLLLRAATLRSEQLEVSPAPALEPFQRITTVRLS